MGKSKTQTPEAEVADNNISSTQPALLDAPKNAAEALDQFNAAAAGDDFDPFTATAGMTRLPDDFVIDEDTSKVDQRLPVGHFYGRCTGIRPGKPSSKGDRCWIWELQVCEGEYAGQTVPHYTYTGGGLFKFAEVKESLGFAPDEKITPALVRNRACGWVMEENIFNGVRKSPRVGNVYPHPRLPIGTTIDEDPKPPTDEDIPF